MVIANRYANAFTEVYEILKYLDKEEYNKISFDLIETIQNNRNTNYLYTVKPEKKLKEQKMLPETKAILFNIFRDYLATEEQKQKIKKWQLEDLRKLEEDKKKNYNVDVFFNKNIHNTTISKSGNELIEVKETSLWKKIINKIKNFLKYEFKKKI